MSNKNFQQIKAKLARKIFVPVIALAAVLSFAGYEVVKPARAIAAAPEPEMPYEFATPAAEPMQAEPEPFIDSTPKPEFGEDTWSKAKAVAQREQPVEELFEKTDPGVEPIAEEEELQADAGDAQSAAAQSPVVQEPIPAAPGRPSRSCSSRGRGPWKCPDTRCGRSTRCPSRHGPA